MKEQSIKRDNLADERTHLANERTLLAYWRTSLAFLVSGAFLIKFVPSVYFIILAVASILFGIVLFIYGTARHIKYKKKINNS